MIKKAIATLFAAIFLINLSLAMPQDISINGKLTNTAGTALTGQQNITFSIYNTPTGSATLWQSANQSVYCDSFGVFNARLTNIRVNFSEQFYLSIIVNTDPEMSPRINLSSVPYAYRAKNISIEGVEFVRNINIQEKNLTSTGTGFFNFLGSIFTRISNLFVQDINVNGTLNVTGEILLNNSAVSIWLYNQTTGTYNLYDTRWTDTYNSTYQIWNYNQTTESNKTIYTVYNTQWVDTYNSTYQTWAYNQTADSSQYSYNQTRWSGGNNIYYNSGNVTVNNSVFFVNANTGNVGIGTTGPATILHLYQNNALANSPSALKLEQDGTGDAAVHYLLTDEAQFIHGIDNSDANKFKMGHTSTFDGAISWFTIDSSGNVGIGTSSPSSKLEVAKSAGTNEVNLSGVMYVNSTSGNVGIGTTGPGYKLDIQGTVSKMRLKNTGSDDALVYLTPGTGSKARIYMGLAADDDEGQIEYNPASDYMFFTVGTSEMMRIINDGSASGVGIGYTSLGTGAKLAINGNVGIGTTAPTSKLQVESGNFHVNGSGSSAGLFYNSTSGNLGIGTTAPSVKLNVVTSGQEGLLVENNGGTYTGIGIKGNQTGDASWYLYSGYPNAGDFTLRESGVGNYLTVKKTSGNVGIGTTAPSAKLEIAKSGTGIHELNVSGVMYVNSTSGNVGIGNTTPVTTLQVGTNTLSVNTTSGKIGIGTTSPNSKLTLGSGSIELTDVTNILWGSDASAFIQGGVTTDYLAFGTGNSEAVRINNNGNVGIGNTTPVTTLQVGTNTLSVNTTSGNVGIGTASPNGKMHITGGDIIFDI